MSLKIVKFGDWVCASIEHLTVKAHRSFLKIHYLKPHPPFIETWYMKSYAKITVVYAFAENNISVLYEYG